MIRRKLKKQNIKKGIMIGIGLTAIAVEKVEKVAKFYLKKNKISNKKAKLVARKAVNELKKNKKIAGVIEKELKKVINKHILKEKPKKRKKKKTKKKRKK